MTTIEKEVMLTELRQMLNEWDPIGVMPFSGGSIDEYGDAIDPILSILRKSAKREHLVNCLVSYTETHCGLPPMRESVENFSDVVLVWWKIRNGDF